LWRVHLLARGWIFLFVAACDPEEKGATGYCNCDSAGIHKKRAGGDAAAGLKE
jgi:hypothetical protein